MFERLPVRVLNLIGCLGLAAAAWAWLAVGPAESLGLAGLAIIALIASGLLENQHLRTTSVVSSLSLWTEAEQRASDLETVRREQAKLRMSLDGLSNTLGMKTSALEERERDLLKQLAALESLLLEARQARQAALELERHWDEFAVSMITLLHRSKDLDAVRGVYEHVVEGLQGLGIDVIEPRREMPVSELHHRVVAAEHSDDVQPGGVIRVAAPGLRRGNYVIRHAEVVVQNTTAAEKSAPDGGPVATPASQHLSDS